MLHIDRFTTVYLCFLAAFIGAVGGSFINCLSWRMAHGEKVTKGRSHCTACGYVLGLPDLVPVFSWLFLKGRCRHCGGKISPRYIIVELLAAAWSVALLYRFDVSINYIYFLVFSFLLLAEGLVDLETYEIPDRFHVAAILWWCLFLPVHSGAVMPYLMDSLAGGLFIGGGLLGISLIFDKVMGRESLGGGDIKLFFVTGLYLGFAVNLLNVIISCAFGLIFAAASIKARQHTKDPAAIPFGPAIGAGTLVCILVGRTVVDWYMGFFL